MHITSHLVKKNSDSIITEIDANVDVFWTGTTISLKFLNKDTHGPAT